MHHAAANYLALYPVDSAKQALTLATRAGRRLRVRVAAGVLLAAASDGSAVPDATARRRDAQAALSAAAVRAARWRKIAGIVPASRAFPGI